VTAAVKQLVQDFERDLRAAALEQLLEEMVAFTSSRRSSRNDAKRARPPRPRPKRRRRRRMPRAPADFPRNPDGHVSRRYTLAGDDLVVTSPAAETLAPRSVVVRIDGGPSKLALLVAAPAPGFWGVRLWRGRGRYSHKTRRIVTSELVRDATPREVELGYVVPGVTS